MDGPDDLCRSVRAGLNHSPRHEPLPPAFEQASPELDREDKIDAARIPDSDAGEATADSFESVVAAAAAVSMTPGVEIIRSADALAALEQEWDDLYQRSRPRNPFLSYAWTRACLQIRQGQFEPFVVAQRSGGRLIGIAPLCLETRRGFRLLRFIGDERSDYLGLVCAQDVPGAEQQLLEAVLAEPGWDVAVFQQLAEPYSQLLTCTAGKDFQRHAVQWTTAPYCASNADWDSLHVEGPTWLKRTRKRLRRFLKDGWKIERFTGQDAANRLDEVAAIEARSWKALEGATRLQPGGGQDLLRSAFEHLQDGEIELWLASLEGQPAAFQVGFRLPDRLWIYQQAFDEESRRTSVGSFMAYVSFETAWLGGAREYDYLCGEESYKLERTNALREVYHLALHRRTVRGRVAYLCLIAPRWRLRHVPSLRAIYKFMQSAKRTLAGKNRG